MTPKQLLTLDPFSTAPNFIKNTSGLVHQLLPILASVPVSSYSAQSVFKALKSNEYFETPAGYITAGNMINWYKYFSTTVPSNYVSGQTKNPSICSGVPIILLAFKQQHGIKYSSWDKEDPYFSKLLGNHLDFLLNREIIDKALSYSTDDLLEFREATLLEKSTGNIKPVTAYKMSTTRDSEFNQLPKQLRFLLVQTWIYHPSCRHSNMITNLENWDDAAEPLAEFNIPTKKLDLCDW